MILNLGAERLHEQCRCIYHSIGRLEQTRTCITVMYTLATSGFQGLGLEIGQKRMRLIDGAAGVGLVPCVINVNGWREHENIGHSHSRRSLYSHDCIVSYDLLNEICPCHVPAAINNRPPAPVLDTTDKTHHCIDVDSSWCHLGTVSVVRDIQGRLVCCFPWIYDGEGNSLGLGDWWDDPRW